MNCTPPRHHSSPEHWTRPSPSRQTPCTLSSGRAGFRGPSGDACVAGARCQRSAAAGTCAACSIVSRRGNRRPGRPLSSRTAAGGRRGDGWPVAGLHPCSQISGPQRHVVASVGASRQHRHRRGSAPQEAPHDTQHDDPGQLSSARHPGEPEGGDWIILPGSRQVSGDLQWLRDRGTDRAITRHAAAGKRIPGVCGGLQMRGAGPTDPHDIKGPADEIRTGVTACTSRNLARCASQSLFAMTGRHDRPAMRGGAGRVEARSVRQQSCAHSWAPR
jgi:hypothetical protein